MTAASLIVFALVFFVASAFMSLLLGIGLRCARQRLRALGARAEQRAATLALLWPPALALVLVGFLAAEKAMLLLGGMDHCEAHSHHLHLCLLHGGAWATRPWAVAMLAVVLCFLVVRFVQISWAHIAAQRAAWRFRRMGVPLGGGDRCSLVPLNEPLVFTTGVFSPTVVISQGAWQRLNVDERQAVMEHELAHVTNGDLWRRALLTFASCFAAPGVASFALRVWDQSAERICDRRAADAVGRPTVVAGAIVAIARAMSRVRTPIGTVSAAACNITERVQSLLNTEPDGARGAARLLLLFVGLGIGITLASAAFSTQIHHLLETILG